MAIFRYKGVERNGLRKSGIVTADNKQECMNYLLDNGIYVTSIRRQFSVISRVDNNELIQFFTHFLFQIKCHVPILHAIHSYIEISDNTDMNTILEKLCRMMKRGETIYNTFSSEPKIFGSIIPSLLQSAESSGLLENSLESTLTYLKFKKQIKQKINKAIMYPVYVLLVAAITFLLSINGLAPQVKELIGEKGDHSFCTKLCFAMIPQDGDCTIIWPCLLVISAIIFVLPRNKLLLIGVKVPILKRLIKKIYEWNCCTILYIAFESKMDMVSSIKLLISSLSGTPFQNRFEHFLNEIMCGVKFSDALTITGIFGQDLIYPLKIGEESNELTSTLRSIIENQNTEISSMIVRLSTNISILITVVTGILLMIILLGLFYPLYSYIDIVN